MFVYVWFCTYNSMKREAYCWRETVPVERRDQAVNQSGILKQTQEGMFQPTLNVFEPYLVFLCQSEKISREIGKEQ